MITVYSLSLKYINKPMYIITSDIRSITASKKPPRIEVVFVYLARDPSNKSNRLEITTIIPDTSKYPCVISIIVTIEKNSPMIVIKFGEIFSFARIGITDKFKSLFMCFFMSDLKS